MLRFSRRAILIAVLVSAGLTACSSSVGSRGGTSSTTGTVPKTISPVWDRSGTKAGQDLAAKIIKAGLGCEDAVALVRGAFLPAFYKLGWPIPLAVGHCHLTANREDVQIEVYQTNAQVERRIATRTKRLCTVKNFPGYASVKGDRFLVIPDEKATAARLMPIIGGTEHFASCAKR